MLAAHPQSSSAGQRARPEPLLSVTSPPGSRAPYSWFTIAQLLVLLTVANGIIATGIPVFDLQILQELGITRGALKFRDFVQIMSAGCAGLGIGYLATRMQPRRIAQLGLLLLGICLLAYGAVRDVRDVYLLHVALGFCYSSAHAIIVVLIVQRWFATRRSGAIGIALAGTSLGSAIFPQVGVWLLGEYGWRQGLQAFAVFPLLLLPLLLVFLKDGPASVGAVRYGEAAAADSDRATTAQGQEFAPERPILVSDVVLLALGTFGVFYASAAMAAHTFLNLRDQGLSPQQAATGLSTLFITGLVGKTISGFAADRWGTANVWLVHQALLLLGIASLTYVGIAGRWPGLVLLGYGWGGCFSLTQMMIADRFAGPRLSRLMGWFILFEGLSAGLGSWLTGVLFDRSGNYLMPFTVCILLVVSSIVATTRLRMAIPGSTPAGREPWRPRLP